MLIRHREQANSYKGFASGFQAQDVASYSLGNPNPVNTCRQNPARVTRTFTGREQTFHVQALHRLITGNAQRRRSTGLDAGQYGVVQ